MILVVVTTIAAISYKEIALSKKHHFDKNLIVQIPHNTSITGVVELMNKDGLLEPTWFFKLYCRVYTYFSDGTIYAGRYLFEDGITNSQIVDKLFSGGKLTTFQITFPEGISLNKFAEIVSSNTKFTKKQVKALFTNDSLIKAYEIDANSLEGYLLPNTYEFYKDATLEDIFGKLLDEGKEIWNPKNKARADELGMTKHNIMTLASIIEGETPIAEEMPRVSGVYHNRLKKGWLLQADPTVQYAVNKVKGLTRSDLKVNHPYNTYVKKGLPPGPINLPGKAAILAALYPEEHDFLYFVARGDGSNMHNFSRTNEEHNRFTAQYRRNLRNKD